MHALNHQQEGRTFSIKENAPLPTCLCLLILSFALSPKIHFWLARIMSREESNIHSFLSFFLSFFLFSKTFKRCFSLFSAVNFFEFIFKRKKIFSFIFIFFREIYFSNEVFQNQNTIPQNHIVIHHNLEKNLSHLHNPLRPSGIAYSILTIFFGGVFNNIAPCC